MDDFFEKCHCCKNGFDHTCMAKNGVCNWCFSIYGTGDEEIAKEHWDNAMAHGDIAMEGTFDEALN